MAKIKLEDIFPETDTKVELHFADLYAGIGYFTLQIIKSNLKNIKKVSLFEWNPNAIKYLKINIDLNFPDKFTLNQNLNIFQGDNRQNIDEIYRHQYNRINLGLIPCSCGSLPQAIFLSNLPCLLHVHHNIDKPSENPSLTRPEGLFDPNCLIKNPENYQNFSEILGNYL